MYDGGAALVGFDARCAHQGVYSAWLTKTKGENAKARWFSSATKRHFTIDYSTQIFYYSHSPTDKKSVTPVRFKDMISADQLPRSADLKSEHSFGFSLLTAERTYELYTSTYQDAELWVVGLNAARDISNGKVPSGGTAANVREVSRNSHSTTSSSVGGPFAGSEIEGTGSGNSTERHGGQSHALG
ncbi:unnamed protein product [Polarella glacialis]|uniref:PH domain-containing protein n=1 Tax=Polarella glacialis TaxID=89957 RepID=A0A813FD31_POLGL|nr:unnamed protein product [Polarella glacialis]CAE8689558.1 unnamed protein product [Polarella glacialis]